MKWFDVWWYKYLFGFELFRDNEWLSRLVCRIKNHPCGIVYYNPNGFKPDNTCKNCGDEL